MSKQEEPREYSYITTKYVDTEYISNNKKAIEATLRMYENQKAEPKETKLIEKSAYNKLKAENEELKIRLKESEYMARGMRQ